MTVTYFVRMRALDGHADEVEQLLLSNPRRIEEGEPGNLAFAVHRSRENRNEFWLYETWESEAAVERHESGPAFARYKELLRPLVDPDTLLFGDGVPVKALGYALPGTASVGRRVVDAFASGDPGDLYAEDAILYTPLVRAEGRAAIASYLAELPRGFPGLRVALHDEFSDPSGDRVCLRTKLHFRNTGSFHGAAPTGRSGTQTETHSLRLAGDGRIREHWIGANSFQLPQLILADWGLDHREDGDDPASAITEGAAGESPPATPGTTPAQRLVEAFGRRDLDALRDVYAEDVQLFTPLAWPADGRDAVIDFVDQFHTGYPGLRVVLHDEFYSADGERGCLRFKLHYHHTGRFFGQPPTGEQSTMTETHAIRVRDGRITEEWVGDNGLQLPRHELVVWKMDFPRDTFDPQPEVASARHPA
jgi:quinol monooxygenase YgiN/predicted ester cyclase